MPATNRIQNQADDSVAGSNWSAARRLFGDALQTLTATITDSRIGVAFYDRRFRCQALNRAFADLFSVAAEELLGKSVSQIFGSGDKSLKTALQLAFSSGSIVSNFELTAPAAGGAPAPRLLVNFYPLKDNGDLVRVVAATFVKGGSADPAEFYLAHLVAKVQEGLPAKSRTIHAGSPEGLAQCLLEASRTVHALRNSMSPRSLLSGLQIETGLLPMALFLHLADCESAAAATSLQHAQLFEATPDPYSGVTPQPLMDAPSPRELQVLRQLAAGQSNKEIGLALGISTRTVETYRARIIRKLSLHSTAELVRYAIRNKIIEL